MDGEKQALIHIKSFKLTGEQIFGEQDVPIHEAFDGGAFTIHLRPLFLKPGQKKVGVLFPSKAADFADILDKLREYLADKDLPVTLKPEAGQNGEPYFMTIAISTPRLDEFACRSQILADIETFSFGTSKATDGSGKRTEAFQRNLNEICQRLGEIAQKVREACMIKNEGKPASPPGSVTHYRT